MTQTANQKNKRLAERDRDALLIFAKKQIEATEDRSVLDNAYELAAETISAAVKKINPPADMKTLARPNSISTHIRRRPRPAKSQ